MDGTVEGARGRRVDVDRRGIPSKNVPATRCLGRRSTHGLFRFRATRSAARRPTSRLSASFKRRRAQGPDRQAGRHRQRHLHADRARHRAGDLRGVAPGRPTQARHRAGPGRLGADHRLPVRWTGHADGNPGRHGARRESGVLIRSGAGAGDSPPVQTIVFDKTGFDHAGPTGRNRSAACEPARRGTAPPGRVGRAGQRAFLGEAIVRGSPARIELGEPEDFARRRPGDPGDFGGSGCSWAIGPSWPARHSLGS